MSAVDLGEEVSNTVIRVREEEQEEEEEEEELEQTETQKLTVCRPPKKGVYQPITGPDYIQLERLEEFGNFPDVYMRRLRAYIMRGYSFSQAQELLRVV
tara:strand:- start:1235 stop:1531 length:297 start_codon:yes stop_codon:yes gene_type:complete